MPHIRRRSRCVACAVKRKENHLSNSKVKNVAPGWFEYSHSPDNRALTKPSPRLRIWLQTSRCNQSLNLFQRSSAQVKSSDPACQVLVLNLIETCLIHQERELGLVRKLLHRRG